MAEKILRDKDESSTSEDAFRQAAALLQRRDAANRSADQSTAAVWPDSLPVQDDERGLGVDAEKALSAFERAAAAVQGEEPPITSFDDLAVAEPEPLGFGEMLDDKDDVREESDESSGAIEESEQPTLHPSELPAEPTEEEPMLERPLRPEELPQVITADMLRQRMAARQQGSSFGPAIGSPDELEVPPELLDSLDAAEESNGETDEQERKHSKARRGSPTTPKKQPKRQRARRSRGGDVDLNELDDDEFAT